ncbi:MAG TPA: peroxiredoxin-like family protein [Acidimicrobiia bacterium]|jgi:peroxiredoxin|nr:peroxiredoxin-like family protein [Acidimicrobiia bacterium]
MDLSALSAVSLPDPSGDPHRLGDLWRDQPVVVVFLRHFGCLHCREHAAELRDRYEDLQRQGVELVAIGTGDQRYAGAFVRDEHIPYLVLVDDDGTAADAASVGVASWYRLLHPSTWAATVATWKRGHRIHQPGKRVTQLGATFVVGPGDQLRYSHVDADSTDHASVPDVLAAVGV